MDGGTISGAAVSSVFTATLRISQIAYELKAVGEQTRDLLDSTNHVQTTMQAVRTLRRQKSMHLEKTEKDWIDDVLVNTEKTLGNVASLIEPARVDMQTKFGSVGLLRRGIFVFRDSPRVATNLSRLGLASQSLNTVMNILCSRDGHVPVTHFEKTSPSITVGTGSASNEALMQPPNYEESEFLNRRRSYVKLAPASTETPVMRMEVMEEQPPQPSATIFDDGLIPIVPMVDVIEIIPTTDNSTKKNPFNESEGLQIYHGTLEESDGLQVYSEWNPVIPASVDSQIQHNDLPEWCGQRQSHLQSHLQWSTPQNPQYHYWHREDPSRQSCVSLQCSASRPIRPPSFEMSPRLDLETQGDPSRPMSTLSHSSSAYDLRSPSTSRLGSRERGGSGLTGRQGRKAWLEYQSER